jgi:hypothetical protein
VPEVSSRSRVLGGVGLRAGVRDSAGLGCAARDPGVTGPVREAGGAAAQVRVEPTVSSGALGVQRPVAGRCPCPGLREKAPSAFGDPLRGLPVNGTACEGDPWHARGTRGGLGPGEVPGSGPSRVRRPRPGVRVRGAVCCSAGGAGRGAGCGQGAGLGCLTWLWDLAVGGRAGVRPSRGPVAGWCEAGRACRAWPGRAA